MSGELAVSVVVPTRDRPEQLAACLAALDRQEGPPFEVVVVDDASADGEAVAAAVARSPRARLVQAGGRGPAAARNLGAAAARAPVVCFVDDDCRPEPGWLAAIARRVDAGAAAVAGPTRNGRPGDPFATASQTITNHLVEASHDAGASSVGFAPTSNLACRANVLRRLPFDEGFPLAAGEDRDWCARLADEGITLAFESAAVVEHHQVLGWRGFWRQQVRYGRGAARLRSGPAPLRFYAALLRKGAARGPAVGALVVLAQVAVAVGIAAETVAARRRRRAAS